MGDKTKIEWADATWNPIAGCSVVSPGCTNCYAMRLAGGRLKHHPSRAGLTTPSRAGPVWNGEVRFNEKWLDQPLRWRRPRRIFVCAHGDLFHEDVPDEWINRVFSVMALAPQHRFQVLTKRADRMQRYFAAGEYPVVRRWGAAPFPLPNVWLGVSVEDQERADERIPYLLETQAAVRFLSVEPLLSPITLDCMALSHWPSNYGIIPGYAGTYNALLGSWWPLEGGDFEKEFRGRLEELPKLDWVIAGGESGPHARPIHRDWARSIRDQCVAAGVPFFWKQWGEWAPTPVERISKPLPGSIVPRKWTYAKRRHEFDDGTSAYWVGKRFAGRLLDGRTWDEMPA